MESACHAMLPTCMLASLRAQHWASIRCNEEKILRIPRWKVSRRTSVKSGARAVNLFTKYCFEGKRGQWVVDGRFVGFSVGNT